MSNTGALQIASELFASYRGPSSEATRIGEAALKVLLQGRIPDELSVPEMHCLLRAYNWAHRHDDCYTQAKNSLRRWGNEFLQDLDTALHNAYYWPKGAYIAKADELITEDVGPAVHWHLLKADWWLREATGEHDSEQEWMPGDNVVNPSSLEKAAIELDSAIAKSVPGARLPDASWEGRYAPILEQSRFARFRLSEA